MNRRALLFSSSSSRVFVVLVAVVLVLIRAGQISERNSNAHAFSFIVQRRTRGTTRATTTGTTTTSAVGPKNHHWKELPLPLQQRQRPPLTTPASSMTTTTTTTLFMSGDDGNKKKGGLDENVRNKLVSESMAPWRFVRLFLYGSFASGAFIGGLITLSGAVAALSKGGDASTDVDMNAEYLNLAIDFGAVAVFGFLFKLDMDKQDELNVRIEEKMERKREQKKVVAAMREREERLRRLSLEVRVRADGTTQQAAVGDLQKGARQHVILVIGPKKACKDALVGANLLKMDFALNNVLVVPYETDDREGQEEKQILDAAGGGQGFGGDGRPSYETQPYVARPAGEGWDEYVAEELKDAVRQNGEKAKEEGIAIVVANTGKVIRRGIGKVPWRQMVEQLEKEAVVVSVSSSTPAQ